MGYSGNPLQKPTIVIDPGHGGNDIGGANPHFPAWPDKRISLATALAFKKRLGSRYKVHLTRSTDTFPDLNQRYYKALRFWHQLSGSQQEKQRSFCFVSLHANLALRNTARGAIVFRSPGHWLKTARAFNDPLQQLNRGMGYTGRDIWAPQEEGKIDANGHQKWKKMWLLRRLATPPHAAPFSHVAGKPPALLIELGFMSNAGESALLTRPEHHEKLAGALHKGLDIFMDTANRLCTVTGRVIDEKGRPVSRADIRLTTDNRDYSGNQETLKLRSQSNGRFRFNLKLGTWHMVTAGPSGGYKLHEDFIDPTHERLDLGDLVLRKSAGTVSRWFGQIRSFKTPAKGINDITLTGRQGNKKISAVTKSNPLFDGLFVLGFPSFGSWEVMIEDPKGRYESVRTVVSVDPMTIVGDLLMHPMGSYKKRGKVLAVAPGFPALPGIRVEASAGGSQISTLSDRGGNFDLTFPFAEKWTINYLDPKGQYLPKKTSFDIDVFKPVPEIPVARLKKK